MCVCVLLFEFDSFGVMVSDVFGFDCIDLFVLLLGFLFWLFERFGVFFEDGVVFV